MSRTVKARNEYHPKPVKRIKLQDQNLKVRVVIVILLLAIGAAALAHSISSIFSTESGWTEIEASSSTGAISSEFVFEYNLGVGVEAASTEKTSITSLYSDTLEKAYELFDSSEEFDEVHNPYYLNSHPNEIVEVDSVLYQAFEQLENANNRNLYLAPVYAEYNNLFFCNNDFEIVNYDPFQNQEVLEYFSEIISFAKDATMINLELLGDNQVRLVVSEEYLTYAKEIGFNSFIDFFWMKNAFIVDYLAEVMTQNGYTSGIITSFDGFSRNLDASGTNYSLQINNREDNAVYAAGVMQYDTSLSIVTYRNYPMNELDTQHYYELESGEIRTAYVDIQDGLCKSAISDLIVYSKTSGCAELMLQTSPIFIADQLEKEQLLTLKDNGIYYIYSEDTALRYNDSEVVLSDFYNNNGITYHSEFDSVE